ncbi:hypothetical protein [Mucilaginibacter sp. SG564]|uniref:hypothetical protein n=1 Tax=Mucilaginibacter sp. SG564 TaxID=2587022 RepID=UPI00155390B1|nr:hypothetical protein [Mucilaginibacter sp. SG564]NOW98753.1 hypothetical protein [Mucilaginibacter sp. SG564]
MKKLIFSLFLFLSFSSLVQAQWTTNGTITSTSNSIGIGTTTPQSLLHIVGAGTFINQSTQFDAKSLIIQSNNGGRGLANGAQLEFVIPANTDGSNPWGQARIITVAGNGNTSDATGKMVLGTRRMFNKVGSGATWYYGDDITIDGGGNVGIGTTTPSASLTVDPQGPGGVVIGNSNTGAGGFTSLLLKISAKQNGYSTIESIQSSGSTLGNLFLNPNGGNVGIGITDTKGYKFAVNGNVIATSVTVKAAGTWPDYVFKKDYQLRPLSEVKAYIDQNQHLPEVPSDQVIAKEGLNLGEMNKLLMKKVEELTLYLIDKDQKITDLQNQIDVIKKQIAK